MITYKCDKCGKEYKLDVGTSGPFPETWYLLKFATGGYPSWVEYHVCPECRKALGIPETATENDVAARLITILEEIARDAVGG